jgi:hypothetical protein
MTRYTLSLHDRMFKLDTQLVDMRFNQIVWHFRWIFVAAVLIAFVIAMGLLHWYLPPRISETLRYVSVFCGGIIVTALVGYWSTR